MYEEKNQLNCKMLLTVCSHEWNEHGGEDCEEGLHFEWIAAEVKFRSEGKHYTLPILIRIPSMASTLHSENGKWSVHRFSENLALPLCGIAVIDECNGVYHDGPLA